MTYTAKKLYNFALAGGDGNGKLRHGQLVQSVHDKIGVGREPFAHAGERFYAAFTEDFPIEQFLSVGELDDLRRVMRPIENFGDDFGVFCDRRFSPSSRRETDVRGTGGHATFPFILCQHRFRGA